MTAPDLARSADTTHLDLGVTGMTCTSCSSRVQRKLNKVEGVDAQVNFATETAAIDFDPELSTPQSLIDVVRAAGYDAFDLSDAGDNSTGGAAGDSPTDALSAARDDEARQLARRTIWAAVLSGLFAAFDMIDGTMARIRGGGTPFGATLDASCDRVTDGALFAAIIWYLVYTVDAHPSTVAAGLIVLVSSQVISYVKARGEASGLRMVGGLIERPERLIIGLVGVGLEGFGVPNALAIALWILAVGSVFTIYQRLIMAMKQDKVADQA